MEISAHISSLLKKHENSYINQLLLYLPPSYTKIASSSENNYEKIISGLRKLCSQTKNDEDIDDFFKEIGVDKKQWMKLDNADEKFNFIVKNLEKCVDESIKKVNTQIDNYVINTKKIATSSTANKENKNKDHFEWLKLKNKYPMCQPKLKAKLVQAISDSKNEKRIRERMSDPENLPKVSLLDESLVVDQYERIKIDYKWTDEDEKLFINNVNSLKVKFNSTQFLKKCNRFRFISDHELQTLAAEQISRRLDQDNKIYLSREFLLDKYYSTRDFLTEQQMRFILKTSPMLSKCVDKGFIRTALKNIQYGDINKLQLKIAENIISRFDQIRKAVRESRKTFKQSKNNSIKQRIVEFEAKKQFEIIREIARQQLKRHKVRKIAPRSEANLKHIPMNLQSKKRFLPLNQYHPPSGLFVKDCNEQCNDDLFNHYETNYIEKQKIHNIHEKTPSNSISMLQFYTGGIEHKPPSIPFQAINTICQIFKLQYYQKALRETLENYEFSVPNQVSYRTQRSGMFLKQPSIYDLDKRPRTNCKIPEQTSQAIIKKKLMQNKQKAKAVVYVNKLLVLAAQNSYTSFKALNAKYTAQQINTKDMRGNTALFYAAKNQNFEFINHLLNMGADPSISCDKQYTPLHFIFKSNNINLITRCLCSPKTPNLNAINNENKTPLAYCTHDVLTRLNLRQGVVVVQNRKIDFDNNCLLSKDKLQKLADGLSFEMGRANSRMKIS